MEERTSNHEEWYCFTRKCPKSQFGFVSQIIIIYIIIISSVINLSIENGDKTLWCTLLASSLGCLMPNPRLKSIKNHKTNGNILP